MTKVGDAVGGAFDAVLAIARFYLKIKEIRQGEGFSAYVERHIPSALKPKLPALLPGHGEREQPASAQDPRPGRAVNEEEARMAKLRQQVAAMGAALEPKPELKAPVAVDRYSHLERRPSVRARR